MRYLLAIVPFALVATLSAQTLPHRHKRFSSAAACSPRRRLGTRRISSSRWPRSRPTSPDRTMMMMRTLPTSFNVTNLPLRTLIMQAYRLSNYQLVGASELDRLRALRHRRQSARRLDAGSDDADAARPARGSVQAEGARRNAGDADLRARAGARATASSGRSCRRAPMIARRFSRSVARPRQAARAGGSGPVPFTMPGPNEKPVCTISMRPTPVTNGLPVLIFQGRRPADAGHRESDLRSSSTNASSIARDSPVCTISSCSSRWAGRCH